MLRTALLSATAALGLALPATAEAHPTGYYPPPPGYPTYYPPARGYPADYAPPCRTWQVLYRTCHAEPWRVYGSYRQEYSARRVARGLGADGFQVRLTLGG